MSKIQYVIKGYIAFSEQDNYENGCILETSQTEFNDHYECKADNLKDLIAKLTLEFSASSVEDFLFDSCDELGRLDLQVYQTKPFHCSKPNSSTLDQWKQGKRDMWLTCYSFKVIQVITEFSLVELMSSEESQ